MIAVVGSTFLRRNFFTPINHFVTKTFLRQFFLHQLIILGQHIFYAKNCILRQN